jgi:Protein of unknown function (DUF1553)/Protein of unknown function (DUF1549)/Planctomycete cytochrome C
MRTFLSLVLTLAVIQTGTAAPSGEAGVEFFEKKIRPVLVQHCYSCHATDAPKKRGGLLLDSRDGLRKGGDTGPALVAGKPDESLLIKAVRFKEESFKMPPKGKLPDAVIADLEAWVRMGAPDPRDAVPTRTAQTWEEMLRTRRDWWSLQPVRKPDVPPVKDAAWSKHPIDRFLLAALEKKGLAPAQPANARTLIRRLSLVLTGLPPTAEETEAFLRDQSPDAYEKLVDRMLASPHFGERWARHWMDVVRFSETHGNEWNYEVHHAWRYRDYLIRAFNDDVPYDQFVREHIAGDLLPRPRWNSKEHFNESVIGTAFYRFGEVNHDDCIDLRSIGYDLADNQIDTLTKAFQATTAACARCHDHKIDAVSSKDYYALLGIVRGSRLVSQTIDAPEVNARPMQQLRQLKPAIRKELGAVWLTEAHEVGRYLLAAQAQHAKQPDAVDRAKGLDPKRLERWVAALLGDKNAGEDPLETWRTLALGKAGPAFAAAWKKIVDDYARTEQEHSAFNDKHFATYADFRGGAPSGWQVGGHGLREGFSHSGDFVIQPEGDALIRTLLPAGCFTHTLSDRLNGTLRSPVLPAGKKFISFQVMGRRSSAVRLVSNNCQLNYTNYRALTSENPQWVRFPVPAECENLRTYAELMTLLDNPKVPDQLSSLGGDPENYKLPWEKVIANPHSFFGVTRIVLHDAAETPHLQRSWLRPLFLGAEPAGLNDVAARYTSVVETAVRAWVADQATDDDVRWLDLLLRRGLLGNSIHQTPRLEALAAEYRGTEAKLEQPRIVPGLADCGPGVEQPIFARGDCMKPGLPAPRRYLEVLSQPGDRFESAGSGRLQLAERIADPRNPLTARVMVNRVWHHLFGAGIVRTVDDFGRVGEPPSHPELLDYLAARFLEDGYSVKQLIRSLVLTKAFRQANRPTPAAREVDPENRLLHHYAVRRMEAEAIRDAILFASGRLDRTLFGPSIQPYREKENADRRLFPGPLDGDGRRSVYIRNNLMEAPKFLGAFNFPGGKVTQGRRDVTNVPAQALALLNDPFVLQQADGWARRLVGRQADTIAGRVEHMFQTALGRPPGSEERKRFERAAGQIAELHGVAADKVLASQAVWKDLAHPMFNLKEFISIP